MEIMSKHPGRHLVRLQEKLQVPEKENLYIFYVFTIFSNIPMYNHQPISVADLGRSVSQVKP